MSRLQRLRGVLRVREVQESIARSELALANRAVTERDAALAEWAAKTIAWSRETASGSGDAVRSRLVALSAAGRELTAHQARLDAAVGTADAARVDWTAAAQRRDGIERLVGRIAERERAAELAVEQLATDDVAARRFLDQAADTDGASR